MGAQYIPETAADVGLPSVSTIPRLVATVIGDSTDGGTTPDTSTQNSIDALVAMGYPASNIIWAYVPGWVSSNNTFTIPDMTAATAMDAVTLALTGGSFVIADMACVITMESVTMINEASNVFIIPDMTCATTMDSLTLMLSEWANHVIDGTLLPTDAGNLGGAWTLYTNGTTTGSTTTLSGTGQVVIHHAAQASSPGGYGYTLPTATNGVGNEVEVVVKASAITDTVVWNTTMQDGSRFASIHLTKLSGAGVRASYYKDVSGTLTAVEHAVDFAVDTDIAIRIALKGNLVRYWIQGAYMGEFTAYVYGVNSGLIAYANDNSVPSANVDFTFDSIKFKNNGTVSM